MTDDEIDVLLNDLEAGMAADVRAALSLTAHDFAEALDGATELTAARFSVSRIGRMWKRRVGALVDRLRGVGRQGAETAAEGLDAPLPDRWEQNLGNYAEATGTLLSAVGDRLAADAVQALADGLNRDESQEQLKARMLSLFADDGSQLGPGRAERIAATEVTRAWNAGTLAAAQALTGPDRPLVKQWVTRHDSRVRTAHRDTDGQIQFLDDAFDVAGTPMQYPGDPSAPADQTVSCRCVLKTAAPQRKGSDVTASAERSGRAAAERSGRAAADEPVHKGAMIALVPSYADAARLALPEGEPADQLHLTLFYLGEGADWPDGAREALTSRIADVARSFGPVEANVFGAAQWNPQGDEPAWVWNVGHGAGNTGTRLTDVRFEAGWVLDESEGVGGAPQVPDQHDPWSPHICAQYSQDNLADVLAAKTGPVTFDRIRAAFAGEVYDFPLTGAVAEVYEPGDRVRVAGDPHMPGQSTGTVEEVEQGPAYGILFDGTDEVHRWYLGEELVPEADAAGVADAGAADAAGVADVPEALPEADMVPWSTPGSTALAFEDEQTGDGRLFAPGALFWSGGPWPLQYADEMGEGHEGARLAGAITGMDRDGSRIAADGVLYLTQAAGAEAAMLLAQGAPLGVSVDLDDVSLEMVEPGMQPEAAAYSAHLVTASLLPLPDGGWTLSGETAAEWTASGSSLAGESARITVHAGPDCLVPAAAFQITAAAGDGDQGGTVVGEQKSGQYLMRITRARVRGATLVTIPAFEDARITLAETVTAAAAKRPGYAGSSAHDYDRLVRSVLRSPVPVTADAVALSLGIPVSVVRRFLARAAQKGTIIRISRGTYVKPAGTASDLRATGVAAALQSGATPVAAPEELTASATGSVDLPVADRDTAWDGPAAADRVFVWADGDCRKLDRAFAYLADGSDCTLKGSRKLGFCDVVDGTLTIVPRGVFAAQAAVEGARGGTDIPADQLPAVRERLAAVRAHVDEVTGGKEQQQMEASAWTAMQDVPPMPAAWFEQPTDAELPPGGPGINYREGRIFGWVAQAGEPHAGFAKKVTIDGLGRIDTAHFLRQRFTLDNGSTVRAGAFTMNVGHHRDGAECETSACQFDDTRTVAGIVTVGMSARGMWFSGAAAPWLSEWDRQVFMAVQPSYHMKKAPSGVWQLRAVLSVPVPGHSSPLLASAVVERSQMALTASATMAEVDEAVAAAHTASEASDLHATPVASDQPVPATPVAGSVAAPFDYDRLAAALVSAMTTADERRAAEAAELESLKAEALTLYSDITDASEGV